MTLFNPIPLLHNPRFATPGGFTIRRVMISTDDDGVTSRSVVEIPAFGVVVPSGGLGMRRTPEDEQQGGGVTIYTDAVMTLGDAEAGTVADEVVWHDHVYVAKKQDDWTDFGFNVVQAELKDPGGRGAS